LATVLPSLGTAEASSYYWGVRHFEHRYLPPRYVPPSMRRHRAIRPAATPSRSKASRRRSLESVTVEKAVPPGPLQVIVSIGAQRASLYAGGELVEQASISTGTPAYPTPMGVFAVLQKNRHHISNIYHVPMPYMQRITWSGIALHQGPLPGYPASHGCIRLPLEFAQFLWKATKIGARVIVARDEVTPVEIAHPRLPVPKPKADPSSQAAAPSLLIKTADNTAAAASAVKADADGLTTGSIPPTPAVEALSPKEIARRAAPVSVFVSRKDRKLYVRQAMEPLFDTPVTIREPERPLGTHVFTAMGVDADRMRWTVVSIPSAYPRDAQPGGKADRNERRRRNDKAIKAATAVDILPLPGAGEALDRIEIPQDALDRIGEFLKPGSSLIVSDNGIGGETGRGTDFIVLTR
jgi:hypothetical protein